MNDKTYIIEILNQDYSLYKSHIVFTISDAYAWVEKFATKHNAIVEWHTSNHAGIYGKSKRWRTNIAAV